MSLNLNKPGGHNRLPTLLGFVALSALVFFGVRACQHAPVRHPAPPVAAPKPYVPATPVVPTPTTYPTEKGEPLLPDPKLSPGDLMKDARGQYLTADVICAGGYAGTARHVTPGEKQAIFDEYHIDRHSDRFEIDHIVSLELGGSNDPKNLFPQSYTTSKWNAHVKDRLENKLHHMVCVEHSITLQDAQYAIRTNWIAAYEKYLGEP